MTKLMLTLAIGLLLITANTTQARITPPPTVPVRLDAEWEPQEGIIVSYPWYPWFPYGPLFPTLAGMIDAIQEYGVVYILVANDYQANQCHNDLTNFGVPWKNIEFIYYPSAEDDEWTRDYGPWFVCENDSTLSIVDQRYFEGQQICDFFPEFLESHWELGYYGPDIHNEGGNMMTDGHGTMIMTDHILDANPHMTVAEINQIYHDYFGQDTVYIFEGLAGDTWNHIDGWAKFLCDTTIMVAQLNISDPNYQLIENHAAAMAQIPTVYGTPFHIVRCQLPNPWWYTYLNSLLFNGLALVPIYGFTNLDNQALATYQAALGPNWEVIGVNSHWIAWLGGAIHCTTIGVPKHDWDYLVNTNLNLEPVSPPIVIPPNGGSFNCTVQIQNLETQTINFDFWVETRLPNGSIYGPLFKRDGQSLGASVTITRTLTQAVPGSAPAGIYTYRACVGSWLPRVISQADSFTFSKQGIMAGDLSGDWSVSGWNEAQPEIMPIPHACNLESAYPNPFNTSTVLSYELRVPSQVSLKIYDTAGKLVETLVDGWRAAGEHDVTFDGSNLASGVYLAHLRTGEFTQTQKLVLLK